MPLFVEHLLRFGPRDLPKEPPGGVKANAWGDYLDPKKYKHLDRYRVPIMRGVSPEVQPCTSRSAALLSNRGEIPRCTFCTQARSWRRQVTFHGSAQRRPFDYFVLIKVIGVSKIGQWKMNEVESGL